ncbi:hypothetical protein PsorP6_013939 [Peronosclerospora sorghi]|uniref:Uncharacterized protein n=1 Tax=Peronosclerospora sorghi TaxID=230839 RepID=A0ACC0VHQ5_9STRA|nr:hypothetical protein PsorP6_013939 [Peronosclerospora sorghi]
MALQQIQERHENLPPHQQRILQEQVLSLSQDQPLSTVQNRLPFVADEVVTGDPAGSIPQLSMTQAHSSTPSARWMKRRGNLVVRRVEEVSAGVGVGVTAGAGAGKAL